MFKTCGLTDPTECPTTILKWIWFSGKQIINRFVIANRADCIGWRLIPPTVTLRIRLLTVLHPQLQIVFLEMKLKLLRSSVELLVSARRDIVIFFQNAKTEQPNAQRNSEFLFYFDIVACFILIEGRWLFGINVSAFGIQSIHCQDWKLPER